MQGSGHVLYPQKAGLTWALVSLRVALWCRSPRVSSTFSSLGALWIGCPVVVGAPRGVRVPHRPGIITITSLKGTERKCEGQKRQRSYKRSTGSENTERGLFGFELVYKESDSCLKTTCSFKHKTLNWPVHKRLTLLIYHQHTEGSMVCGVSWMFCNTCDNCKYM